MIISKKLIPETYSSSYDMSVFTGLLDLIYNSRLVDTELLKGLHSPNYCAEESIKSLASLFNMDTDNRTAIAAYRRLMKLKGTEQVIIDLAYICGARWVLDPNYSTANKNVLTLPIYFDTFDSDLFFKLLKRLAPVSMIVKIEPRHTPPNL